MLFPADARRPRLWRLLPDSSVEKIRFQTNYCISRLHLSCCCVLDLCSLLLSPSHTHSRVSLPLHLPTRAFIVVFRLSTRPCLLSSALLSHVLLSSLDDDDDEDETETSRASDSLRHLSLSPSPSLPVALFAFRPEFRTMHTMTAAGPSFLLLSPRVSE